MTRFCCALAAAGLLLTPALGVETEPETWTIRGDTMQIVPKELLEKKGFVQETVPAEENGFWTYVEAINTYQDMPENLREQWDYAMKNGFPNGQCKELQEFLKTGPNQRSFLLLQQSLEKPKFQRGFGWSSDDTPASELRNPSALCLMLPSLSPCRQICKMMVLDGKRLVSENQIDKAEDLWVNCMKQGVRESKGLTLIEYLVGCAILNLSTDAVVDSITRDEWTVPQLRSLISELNSIEKKLPEFADVIRREQVFFDCFIDDFLVSLASQSPFRIPNEFSNISNGYFGESCDLPDNTDPGIRFLTDTYRLFLPDQAIRDQGKQHYEAFIKSDRDRSHPIHEDEIFEQIPKWNVMARVFLPSLSRCSDNDEITRMNLRMTKVTAAIRLYTLEHEGNAPTELSELKPYLAPADFKDGFSGKDLVYRQKGDSWALYCIGENRIDDGGNPRKARGDGDIVIQYPARPIEPFVAESDQ